MTTRAASCAMAVLEGDIVELKETIRKLKNMLLKSMKRNTELRTST